MMKIAMNLQYLLLGLIVLLGLVSCYSLPVPSNPEDKKHMNSVDAYVRITENYLAEWDNSDKAQENLNYAFDAYKDISTSGKTSARAVILASQLASLQNEIDKKKKESA